MEWFILYKRKRIIQRPRSSMWQEVELLLFVLKNVRNRLCLLGWLEVIVLTVGHMIIHQPLWDSFCMLMDSHPDTTKGDRLLLHELAKSGSSLCAHPHSVFGVRTTRHPDWPIGIWPDGAFLDKGGAKSRPLLLVDDLIDHHFQVPTGKSWSHLSEEEILVIGDETEVPPQQMFQDESQLIWFGKPQMKLHGEPSPEAWLHNPESMKTGYARCSYPLHHFLK